MVSSEKEKTSIEGTLLMLDNVTPHVAVPVQAIRDGKVIATTLSDESGRYQFTNLIPGQYQLRCQVLGGYVYYGEEGTSEDESGATSLHIERGKTLENIDPRFPEFKKGTWRNYNTLDGLGYNAVLGICCTTDGVLWFATEYGGISHYDGKGFVNFTMKDGLSCDYIRAIYGDPDGAIWFGTWRGGVSRYDGVEFVNFTIETGLAYDYVIAIHRGPDGAMWFGTDGGGVSRYDGKGFVNFTTKDGLAHNTVHAIDHDQNGILWLGTDGGISRYDGEGFINFTTEDGLPNDRVNAIYRAPDGVMWFGTHGGISRYDGREFANLTTENGLVDERVQAIHRDPDGTMWFGTRGGVSRYDEKTFVNFTKEDGLESNWINAIYRDTGGIMWFGTGKSEFYERGGVSRYDDDGFVSFTTKDGLADNCVWASHYDPNGVMWFGTRQGILRYDGKEFVSLTKEDGLAHNNVWAMCRDPDGVMWFGTWGGVSRYDGEEFVNLTTEDGLTSNSVNAIHRDPDGVMWFATSWGGVSRYDGEEFVNLTTEDGLADNVVWAIHRDPGGLIWFGTQGGISRYDGEEFYRPFTTEDGLAHDIIVAIHRDPDGILWLGTWGGGVSRYDGKEFINFTTEDGLADGHVRLIYRDAEGLMWFGTDGGGVLCYDGTAWSSLDARDGLAGNSVYSILQDAKGFLWFGTEGGITRYGRSTTPPRAHIISVTTDRAYHDLSAIPALTPGTRVTIEYSSIDLKTIPEKRQYRCRIQAFEKSLSEKEMDSDWLKPTASDTFDFVLGEPGTYTFEVQAIDRDLNYSEPASVELEVIPDPRNHRIIQLEEHIREQELAELERVHQELEDARQIQQSLLPDSPPDIAGFEIAGISLPAREVNGDFYNYLPLGANTGIVLADVTGKSVKAAMVAALASGTLNAEIGDRQDIWDSPAEILRRLNIRLQPHLIRGMYTAMSLGIVRPEQKQIILSNAGMPYPIMKRRDKVRELEANGMPLGLVDGAEYEDLSIDLESGDLVIFCSDGVIEAVNKANEMYQTERLLESIQQASPGLSAQEMTNLVVRDVTAFMGDEEASDDVTVVVLRCEE